MVLLVATLCKSDKVERLYQAEAEKVSEESQVHDPVSHPFKQPSDRVANINKKISFVPDISDMRCGAHRLLPIETGEDYSTYFTLCKTVLEKVRFEDKVKEKRIIFENNLNTFLY